MIENLTETIHGTLLSVYGTGVLIRGESGTGKSECALELVSRGHALVADDAVALERIGSTLYGSAPTAFTGLLEIRGLGIRDIREVYGNSSVVDECEIDVNIELRSVKNDEELERLGGEPTEIDILGVRLPHFVISNSNRRQMPVIVEFAVKIIRMSNRSADIDLIENYDRSLVS